jgi:DNA primase
MARFSTQKVEEIKQAADIVDVVSEFVSLQPAGKNMKGLCPFHNEKTPSFFVSKERQLFNCFGCGEKGNAIQFISKYKHLEYGEALKYLADKYGIEPDQNYTFAKSDHSEKYFRINELAKQFYSLQLLNLETGTEALKYLKSRGLDEQILNYFEIGYATKQKNELWESLSKDFHDYELLNLGLVTKSQEEYFDVFRNRIIFPIKNEAGKVVGFSGRIFNNEDNTAKYVNSAQTDLFTKSDVLYNLDKAIPFINQNKRLVLMEGFFDVISAYTADVKEAVCSMGTALTLNQARLIKKHTDNVVICYDGDDAGIRATYKALILLSQVGLDVKVALMPDNLDPDDFIRKNSKESFRSVLKNKLLDQYDFVYEVIVLKKDLTKPAEIEKAKLALFEYLDKAASSTIREIYLKKFSNDTKVNYEDILADYHHFQIDNAKIRVIKQNKDKFQPQDKILVKDQKDFILASKTVISYYALFEESRDIINAKIDHIRLSDKRYRELLMALTALYKNEGIINEMTIKRDFFDLNEEELELFKVKKNKPFVEKELLDCLETLIISKCLHDQIELKKEVDYGNLTIEERDDKLRKYFKLQDDINYIRRKRNVKKTNN